MTAEHPAYGFDKGVRGDAGESTVGGEELGGQRPIAGFVSLTSLLVSLWLFVVSSCTSSSFLPLPLLLPPLLPSLAMQALHHQATPLSLMPIFAPVRLPNGVVLGLTLRLSGD